MQPHMGASVVKLVLDETSHSGSHVGARHLAGDRHANCSGEVTPVY